MTTTQGDDLENREASRYATTQADAKERFKRFEALDPFPDIDSALLNSADVSDYVAATGMICPFYEGKQKPASYEVALLGKYVYWDEKGQKHGATILPGKEFILRQNSIAFVTLEPTFRIPEYMALRFNLKITHIYRGILLGTGPLVDPGFVGRLSIPLHNLTTNDYTFVGGDPLIWMEFTKISSRTDWKRNTKERELVNREGKYFPFPCEKKEFGDVENYLRKADAHRAIRSSIPDAIESARTQAEEAARRLRIFTFGGLVAVVAVLITIAFGTLQIAGLFNIVNSQLRESSKELQSVRSELEEQKRKAESLQMQLNEIDGRLKTITTTTARQSKGK